MEKAKQFYHKHEEIINYLWVGVLTTIVAWSCKFIAAIWLNPDDMFQNFLLATINFASGTAFGYFANRRWVFKSKSKNILSEAAKFVGSRLFTYFLDILICNVSQIVLAPKFIYPSIPADSVVFSILGISFTCSKMVLYVTTMISAVVVVILNYVFSKLFVFKKKKKAES